MMHMIVIIMNYKTITFIRSPKVFFVSGLVLQKYKSWFQLQKLDLVRGNLDQN
jgi:hypothetical protein